MIEIDGATGSGSGTILRYAVSLASLLKEELHMVNIRAKRDKPGLRPQHLSSLLACCQMMGGSVEGAKVGSQEILYSPGSSQIQGKNFSWDIGTAGSTTMLALSILPLAIFSQQAHIFTITGGLFQDFAPSAYHFQEVLLPLLRSMGAQVELKILRPGYVPQGQGKLELITHPVFGILRKVSLPEQGRVHLLRGFSLSSHLKDQKVSQRMAQSCQKRLKEAGFDPQVELIEDDSAVQKGAALFVMAQTSTGCFLGADMAGKIGRRAEQIGIEVAKMFLEDWQSGATADRHLSDQLILFAALADGTTEYKIPRLTEHVDTNLWLVHKILGAEIVQKDNKILIKGIGLKR